MRRPIGRPRTCSSWRRSLAEHCSSSSARTLPSRSGSGGCAGTERWRTTKQADRRPRGGATSFKVEDRRHWARPLKDEDEQEEENTDRPEAEQPARRHAPRSLPLPGGPGRGQAARVHRRLQAVPGRGRRVPGTSDARPRPQGGSEVRVGSCASCSTVDDLELALAHVASVPEAEPLARGVSLAVQRFLQILERHGVVRISPTASRSTPPRRRRSAWMPWTIRHSTGWSRRRCGRATGWAISWCDRRRWRSGALPGERGGQAPPLPPLHPSLHPPPPLLGVVSGAVTAWGSAHNPQVLAGVPRAWTPPILATVVLGSLCAALLNAASNAINQYYDLENDRLNKPERPLVTGAISLRRDGGSRSPSTWRRWSPPGSSCPGR